MLIASIETFPSSYLPPEPGQSRRRKDKPHDGEAMGLLFGQRVYKGDYQVFNVGLAVTMQATERDADEVSYSDVHFERIREVTESFPHLEFLGTFHSHPWKKEEFDGSATDPSEADEESAMQAAAEYGEELLEIIVGITALSRNSYRDAKLEGHSIESFCGRYKYRLSAYCTVGAVEEEDDEEEEEEGEEGEDDFEDDEREDEADEDEDEEDEDSEAGLLPVDQLLCPVAAHGGTLFT